MNKNKKLVPEKIVVTRHSGLVDYMISRGIIDESTPVISHATVDDIRGKHVIGIIPIWLAVYADKMTIIKLRIPESMRNTELTLRQIERFASMPRTYRVNKTSFK